MAAEPWIDHTDEKYWQEMITQDLSLAEALIKANQYYLSGYKCYEATKKMLSCWFIKSHLPNELPGKQDLVSFARGIKIFERITAKEIELLEYLDLFFAASKFPEKRAKLNERLTVDSCNTTLSKTNLLRLRIESLKS